MPLFSTISLYLTKLYVTQSCAMASAVTEKFAKHFLSVYTTVQEDYFRSTGQESTVYCIVYNVYCILYSVQVVAWRQEAGKAILTISIRWPSFCLFRLMKCNIISSLFILNSFCTICANIIRGDISYVSNFIVGEGFLSRRFYQI